MADRQVRLYYHPMSYYSQMVLIALKEKEVKYEPVIMNIHGGEQNEAWYMRVNPSGQVPTLQDGEKTIKESMTIVDYIDKEFPTDSKLVPEMSTEMGKAVDRWRKALEEVNVYSVTYGILCYPDLSVSGLKMKPPVTSKTEVLARNQIFGSKAEELADEHPDLREAYSAKATKLTKMSQSLERENVEKALNDLEKTLDEVEGQLKKVDADPSKELWFCGQQFTAADINLCVLMARLHLLGLAERYHSVEKRPYLHAYWEQAKKRPSIKRCSINAYMEMVKWRLRKGAKIVLPILGGLVTVGLAAGLAFVFAQKR
ncbi:hypothetical protein ACOMHN_027341 [Nucella lapillus]